MPTKNNTEPREALFLPVCCLHYFPNFRDSHIRMWNLLKGRCSYTAKLEVEGEAVHFSPGGDAYALVCGNKV